jgi:hypothetical protein
MPDTDALPIFSCRSSLHKREHVCQRLPDTHPALQQRVIAKLVRSGWRKVAIHSTLAIVSICYIEPMLARPCRGRRKSRHEKADDPSVISVARLMIDRKFRASVDPLQSAPYSWSKFTSLDTGISLYQKRHLPSNVITALNFVQTPPIRNLMPPMTKLFLSRHFS